MISIPNCTISYEIKTLNQVSTDPITGEPIFEESGTVESFRASLERNTTEPTVHKLPGKDKTEIDYYGRSDIDSYPLWYTPGCIVDISWDTGFKEQAYIFFSHPSRLGLDSCFGLPIEVSVFH